MSDGVVEENYYTCRGIFRHWAQFLLIDLWSGFAGAAMALLSLGVSVDCLAAETDPFVREVAAENLDGIVQVNSVEEVSVDMVRGSQRYHPWRWQPVPRKQLLEPRPARHWR